MLDNTVVQVSRRVGMRGKTLVILQQHQNLKGQQHQRKQSRKRSKQRRPRRRTSLPWMHPPLPLTLAQLQSHQSPRRRRIRYKSINCVLFVCFNVCFFYLLDMTISPCQSADNYCAKVLTVVMAATKITYSVRV